MRLARFFANAAGRARDDGDLASRPRRRSVPRVESLDDRCLLSLPPTGIGPPSPGMMVRPASFPIQWSYIPNLVNECVHLTDSQGGYGRLAITAEDAAGNFMGIYTNADLNISGLLVNGTIGPESFATSVSSLRFSGHSVSDAPILGFPAYDMQEHQDVTFSGSVSFGPILFANGNGPMVYGSIDAEVSVDLVTSDPSHTLIMNLSHGTDMSGHVSGVLVHC